MSGEKTVEVSWSETGDGKIDILKLHSEEIAKKDAEIANLKERIKYLIREQKDDNARALSIASRMISDLESPCKEAGYHCDYVVDEADKELCPCEWKEIYK